VLCFRKLYRSRKCKLNERPPITFLTPRKVICPRKLHRGAKTIETFVKKYNINSNTVLKWKHRVSFSDKKQVHSLYQKVLLLQQKAIATNLRKHSQLSIRARYHTLTYSIAHSIALTPMTRHQYHTSPMILQSG